MREGRTTAFYAVLSEGLGREDPSAQLLAALRQPLVVVPSTAIVGSILSQLPAGLLTMSPDALARWLDGFRTWLAQSGTRAAGVSPSTAPSTSRPDSPTAPPPEVHALCSRCGVEYSYDERTAWERDSKTCDVMLADGTICNGTLTQVAA